MLLTKCRARARARPNFWLNIRIEVYVFSRIHSMYDLHANEDREDVLTCYGHESPSQEG